MKLYLIHDTDRWGHSLNVVRANSVAEAHQLAGTSQKSEVTELAVDGAAGVLWCHDESPDTNDRD